MSGIESVPVTKVHLKLQRIFSDKMKRKWLIISLKSSCHGLSLMHLINISIIGYWLLSQHCVHYLGVRCHYSTYGGDSWSLSVITDKITGKI